MTRKQLELILEKMDVRRDNMLSQYDKVKHIKNTTLQELYKHDIYINQIAISRIKESLNSYHNNQAP